jgi:hypothetical protein
LIQSISITTRDHFKEVGVANISVVVHPERELTEIICAGDLTIAEVIAELQRSQQGAITRRVLWDVSKVESSTIRGADAAKNSATITSLIQPRVRGKSAVVAETDLTYGLCRMYHAYRENQQLELPFRIFRNRQEALDWLLADAV